MNIPTPLWFFMMLWMFVFFSWGLSTNNSERLKQQIEELRAEINEMKSPKVFLLPDETLETSGRDN